MEHVEEVQEEARKKEVVKEVQEEERQKEVVEEVPKEARLNRAYDQVISRPPLAITAPAIAKLIPSTAALVHGRSRLSSLSSLIRTHDTIEHYWIVKIQVYLYLSVVLIEVC